jgi:hypothetical protein
VLAAVLALASCSADRKAPVADLARPPVDPPAGHVQLFYGATDRLDTGGESRYLVRRALSAPDGTVYVVDDPTSPVAGAESDPSSPRTVVVDSRTGQAAAMDGFSAGGDDVDRPLVSAVGPDGSVYVAAGELDEDVRLYVRSPQGVWRREDRWPEERCDFGSSAPQAVAADGTLYRVCSGEVQAWTPQRGLRVVAGRHLEGIQRPPVVPVDRQRRPAVGASLPFLVTVVAAPGGRLYVISAETVHLVDADGTLRLVAGQGTPAEPGAELFDVQDVDGVGYGSTLVAAAATGDSLLLVDDYLGRLLELGADGRLRLLSQTRPAPETLGRVRDDAAQRPVPVAEAALGAPRSLSVMPEGDVLLAGGNRVLRLGNRS